MIPSAISSDTMTKSEKLTVFRKILCIVMLLLLGGELLFSAMAVTVVAEGTENEQSEVMADLSKDPTFNPADFPADSNDYSLKVIQIAEGTNGELFVYVYQPSAYTKKLYSSGISISTEVGINFHPIRYGITLLSTDGVFHKYKVDNFTLSDEFSKTFNISAIYRYFDSSIDLSPSDDNTISEMSYGVGQTWEISYVNEKEYYSMTYEDLILVENDHVGFLRYVDADYYMFATNTDSHYIAFSTDKPIDDLLQVDIDFNTQTYRHITTISASGTTENEEFGDVLSHSELISKDELFEKNNFAWFPDYEYARIQSTDVFLATEGDIIYDYIKPTLQKTKWVVRFWESEFSAFHNTSTSGGLSVSTTSQSYTIVTDVVLLRMLYTYNGNIYNLGVVDNVQSGDTNPDGIKEPDLLEWLQKIMFFLGIILFFVLLGPILSMLQFLFRGVALILKIIRGLIKFPFKVLGKLIK